jgi:AcrR family transcriptional regulator
MIRKRSDDEFLPKARRAPTGAAIMQPELTDALTRALFKEWADFGYVGISLERVALRAKVGKAALYRRWPSKLAMVTDRLEVVGIDLAPLIDTGTLSGDIRTMLLQLRRILRHRLVRRILPDLHAEMQRNPALAENIRGRLQGERRRRAATVLERAISRGDLPMTVDAKLFNDAAGGLLYWRLIITRELADRDYIDSLVRFIIGGLLPDAKGSD